MQICIVPRASFQLQNTHLCLAEPCYAILAVSGSCLNTRRSERSSFAALSGGLLASPLLRPQPAFHQYIIDCSRTALIQALDKSQEHGTLDSNCQIYGHLSSSKSQLHCKGHGASVNILNPQWQPRQRDACAGGAGCLGPACPILISS